ncbi:MAG: hypothetical protein AB7Q16_24590, partial [Vicinamibacterales bacterium]
MLLLAGLFIAPTAAAAQPEDRQPRLGSLKSDRQMPVPFPGSADPSRIVANILAILQQTDMTFSTEGLRERLLEPGLRAGTVRQVWYSAPRPSGPGRPAPADYFVVDLEDRMGRPLAIVGLTSNDEPIGIEDFRDGPGEPQGDPRLFTGRMRPRPLQLEDPKARASRALGVQVRGARYEHFNHNAETGVAVLRPLVALDTDQGVVYV